MSWLACLALAVAACSMGKDPAKKAAPAVATGTLRGHVTSELHGPGRAHGPEEAFTHISPIDCTVHAGTASARTGSDGTYALTIPVGHVDVSFAECAESCCSGQPATGSADVAAGSAAILDWSCECYAK